MIQESFLEEENIQATGILIYVAAIKTGNV